MESNDVISGKTPDLVLSSSYEAAMRALSSLISGRKRGEAPKRGNKLDLIFNYLKVIPFYCVLKYLFGVFITSKKNIIFHFSGYMYDKVSSSSLRPVLVPSWIDVGPVYTGMPIHVDQCICWHRSKRKREKTGGRVGEERGMEYTERRNMDWICMVQPWTDTGLICNVEIIGVEKSLPELKIIHIGGTKGKGSTCTFCEAILRECGFRTGLFTSPHLMDVRERIRINGLDISEDKFLYYFWDCWNLLKERVDEDLPMPPLFQFLTVLAFKIFVSEKVDVAIIEVGLGGRLDSTNVVKEPVVCGITSLGMDHMEILGDTIGQIASAKAGIFKPHVPAFTVPQLPEAMLALEERASELMIPLTFAPHLIHQ
ncbi:unnamed protein product [Musa textilis]